MSVKFRLDTPQLTAEDKELMDRILKLAEELYDSIDMAPASQAREQAVWLAAETHRSDMGDSSAG